MIWGSALNKDDNPDHAEGLALIEELKSLEERFSEIVHRLNELGATVKDLDEGLVDLYHVREGRLVFLCWKRGEDAFAAWHHVDDGFADRVERDDVGVVEARGRARLLEEALGDVVLHDRALEQLQRDPAAERQVLGQVDLAHRALAEQAADAEVSHPRALGERALAGLEGEGGRDGRDGRGGRGRTRFDHLAERGAARRPSAHARGGVHRSSIGIDRQTLAQACIP
jgi:hypothetical protein